MKKLERGSNYYDKAFRKSEEYKSNWKESHYLPTWIRVINRLEKKNIKILDLGCGTGQFGQMLHDLKYHNYKGYDFSVAAINIAKRLSPQDFELKCIYTSIDYSNYDVLICLEVLEHIQDKKVLSNMPVGSRLIFSVPSFNDYAHLRCFNNFDEVYKYYKDYIDITYYEKIGKFYLVDCIIKKRK